ncbi:DUF2254 domain-containing protein [Kineococcus sp. NBC_00420]|uniref:DUF2254 domain-containing protein n=1 Tax=Kineococcus sp. NBC_00420 TaxID=2903564 RepID=UPI002E1CD6CD
MKGRAMRVRAAVTAARTSLWPVPVACVVLGLVAGIFLPRLDRLADDHVPAWISDLLFSGGPGAARTILDAISSSLITVTSLTFSLTVVTLQLASSQFSPRLLRTFTRDRFVHVTLGIFLATFTYALTVERTVRSADEEGTAFVPQFSVTVAFVLTIASVIALILFLAHLAGEIRVETMLRTVHEDASGTAQAVLGGPRPRGPVAAGLTGDPSADLHPPRSAVPLLARRSGFLVRVDEDAVLAAAVRADVLMVLEPLPGASVVTGTPIAWVWPAGSGTVVGQEVLSDLEEAMADAVVIGPERTEAQDVAFGLRQLTDVATKALSPGINDPTTAVHALGHSSALLCELVGLRLGPKGLYDGEDSDGNDSKHGEGDSVADAGGDGCEGKRRGLRVLVARPSISDLLDLAVAQPRRYGAADPSVLAALYELLRALAWCARADTPQASEAVTAIGNQLSRLDATAAAAAQDGDHDESEAAALHAQGEQVRRALQGVWRSTTTGPIAPFGTGRAR